MRIAGIVNALGHVLAPVVRPLRFIVILSGTALIFAAPVQALPGGRAWIPIDTLGANGHQNVFPGRFEPLRGGALRIVGRGSGGPGQFLVGFEWADSVWKLRWTNRYNSGQTFQTLTPEGRELIVHRALAQRPEGFGHDSLVVADVVGDSLSTADTVMTVSESVVFYSAAATETHEWVAVYDPEYAFIKTAQRRRGERWEVSFLQAQSGDLGVSIAPLTDSTALLVTAGGRIRRDIVTPSGTTEETPDLAEHGFAVSALRPDGQGGYWVTWTSGFESVVVTRRLANGTWTAYDSLTADYKPASPYQLTNSVAISMDGGPRPAISWMAYGQSGTEYVYVSWPTDSGWTRGEQIPGSTKGGAQQLALDENGDIWIGWWKYFDGILWTHSHATAVSSVPSISEQEGRPRLSWTLSAPAEATWWGVMRSRDDGEWERVARVKAGADSAMAWTDTTAPSGQRLRYAIRRECRDTRYQVTSDAAIWEPHGPGLRLDLLGRNPGSDVVDLEVLGAGSGALELGLYDIQGRHLGVRRMQSTGAGRDRLTLPFPRGLESGVYLLKARSADGRESSAVKVVLLR